MWDQIDTPAHKTGDGRLARGALLLQHLMPERKRSRRINLAIDEAVLGLTKANGVGQLCLRNGDCARAVRQQAIRFVNRFDGDRRPLLRLDKVADPKSHPLNRRIGRGINARFIRSRKHETQLMPRD